MRRPAGTNHPSTRSADLVAGKSARMTRLSEKRTVLLCRKRLYLSLRSLRLCAQLEPEELRAEAQRPQRDEKEGFFTEQDGPLFPISKTGGDPCLLDPCCRSPIPRPITGRIRRPLTRRFA